MRQIEFCIPKDVDERTRVKFFIQKDKRNAHDS